MANTYSKMYIHAVFAVKYRQALLHKSFAPEVHQYMASILKASNQIPIRINGMPDHVHLAFIMKPNASVSDLMRKVKAGSSRWINDQRFLSHRFSWQSGFGAFTYGSSQLSTLARYIEQQEIHHKKRSFKEEYIGLLEAFQVEYDDQYLFDWDLLG